LEVQLVGCGDHDWIEIFFRWNVVSPDTLVAIPGILTAGRENVGNVWKLSSAAYNFKRLLSPEAF